MSDEAISDSQAICPHAIGHKVNVITASSATSVQPSQTYIMIHMLQQQGRNNRN